ncbi:CTP synthase C-terminal region-related (seleno)protein [Pseudomonas zhanjiangensis]|uniref:CTP synthase (glutamine hydrolyzing) n=1 Tax=Pseudomonas zhanjiangensis TaxID=3239015 RepID=A0ABV3YX93_9PSED
MRQHVTLGLIGEYDAGVTAHQAIPPALALAAQALQITVNFHWLATDQIGSPQALARFDGLWCVPATPYRSMDGALLAIQHARETGLPFLGTCGGFQHAVVEYARNVLGWSDAEHAETAPQAARAVISALHCALLEVSEPLRLLPGSRLASAYGSDAISEGYRCRFGLNPAFQAALTAGPLRAAATDANGEVRAVELDDHPFFVGTLFQPERRALGGAAAPLVQAFVSACAG